MAKIEIEIPDNEFEHDKEYFIGSLVYIAGEYLAYGHNFKIDINEKEFVTQNSTMDEMINRSQQIINN